MLADRTAGSMARDPVVRCDQMSECRERDHADDRSDRDHRWQHRNAIEQHANRRGRAERDQEVSAQACDPVEHPGGRPSKRAHDHGAELERDHRDQQEQSCAQPKNPEHLLSPIGVAGVRCLFDSSVFGHRSPSLLDDLILHLSTCRPKFSGPWRVQSYYWRAPPKVGGSPTSANVEPQLSARMIVLAFTLRRSEIVQMST